MEGRELKDNSKSGLRRELCVSCEICVAACPRGAVAMDLSGGQFLPFVDEGLCTGCGRCARVCPGLALKGLEALSSGDVYDELDGPCLACYTAHARDPALRAGSTSGGVVTALVSEMLVAGERDYAFVLPFDSFKGFPARLKGTSDASVVRAASGSKYVPASAYEVVKTIEKEPDASYVVVATPCVTDGIKRYMELEGLSDDNVLFFGLFCDRTMSFNFLKHLEGKFARPGETITTIDYRSKERSGWPGDLKVLFSSGREIHLRRSERVRVKEYFQLERCLYCPDKLAARSDIAFGDCYVKGSEDEKGLSNVIVRTSKGSEAFKKHEELLCLERAPLESVRGSQGLSARVRNIVNASLYAGKSKDLRGLTLMERRLAAMRLRSSLKKIEIGKRLSPGQVELSIEVSRAAAAARRVASLGALAVAVGLEGLRNLHPGGRCVSGRLPFKEDGRYIVILGGGLGNIGAQAMTFVAVDELQRRLPGKRVCILTPAEYPLLAGYGPYAFDILPWSREVKTALLTPGIAAFDRAGVLDRESRMAVEAVRKAAVIVDVSGFALSSDLQVKGNFKYLLNIAIASRHRVPFVALPQSFGPFEYSFRYRVCLEPLLRTLLHYPYRLFARESRSAEFLYRYTSANVSPARDIVLEGSGVNPTNIYRDPPPSRDIAVEPGSAGIIPNLRVLEKTNPDNLLSLYRAVIGRLLASGRVVYIIRHSREDLELCRRVKELFSDEEKVRLIAVELNALEAEEVIKRLDLVVASRYHSIVHAYKNGVPALIIGWAEKYVDLTLGFGQEAYLFDARDGLYPPRVLAGLERLLEGIEGERDVIRQKMRAGGVGSAFDVFGPACRGSRVDAQEESEES